MSYVKHEFLNGPSAVDRACEIARQLVHTARGTNDTKRSAIDKVARSAGIPAPVLRRYLHPSQRRKDIPLSVWTRLVESYARILRQRLAELEAEMARVEALDHPHSATQDLLDEATCLCARIADLAGARRNDAAGREAPALTKQQR